MNPDPSSIILLLDDATSDEQFKEIATQLKQLNPPEAHAWLKPYYLGLCYVLHSMLPSLADRKRDSLVMLAEAQATRVKQAMPKHSESYVLEAFCLQAKIMIATFIRGPLYISSVEDALHTALGLDPRNPRAYFLLGQTVFNKPAFMGGGKQKALPIVKKALEEFQVFEPETPLHPNWGEKQTRELLLAL